MCVAPVRSPADSATLTCSTLVERARASILQALDLESALRRFDLGRVID